MRLLLLMFFLLAYELSYAELIPLKKGDTAPYNGILVDAPQMKEFRQINEEKKLLELENLKLKDLSLINDQKVGLYRNQTEALSKELVRSERKAFWQSVGTFALGVIVTGFAAKVAIEATR